MKINPSSVTVAQKRITIPTYPALDPDPNPMFFERRNIQGAKGNIYPHPFTDQLSSQKVQREYQAIFLENEFIELVLLPEIGGRIFAGRDKTNGYDFFYRHTVIKPALIGLFGPWISGGVEFNYPQHHRPSTFDPADFAVEESADGSITVWMGEHDPLNRTKGMVGICLHPGKAVVETKVRLYNRTPFPQTFLWWANAGVHINPKYQVIFPPDVHYAVFHTKAIVVEYPIAKGEYNNGIDYGEGTDVSWWVNSPLPTSFFAAESRYDFFGGYDHERQAGVVHVADGLISPGKKYFTWANGPFGHQWQKNLCDDEGEYLELMAGVYTDNQPDFSWLMPYESKAFSQFWYPVQQIGGMKNANLQAAVNLEVKEGKAHIGVYATEDQPACRVILENNDTVLFETGVDLAPGKPFSAEIPLPSGIEESRLGVKALDAQGKELIRYQPEGELDGWMPEPFQPPAPPAEIESNDLLYLTGLHLEQYRHTRLDPEPYWEEALRRDAEDARCNLALGKSYLRRGLFAQAEEYLRRAVKRLTTYNFNPYDGEAHYQLGLTLQYQGKYDEAMRMFGKAIWNAAWQSAGYYALAQIAGLKGDYRRGLERLEQALAVNGSHLKARDLRCAFLRRLGMPERAESLALETLQIDPLDFWARYESILAAGAQGKEGEAEARLDEMKRMMRDEVQTYLDIAFDYASAGLLDEAVSLLGIPAGFGKLYPMVGYALGSWLKELGKPAEAEEWLDRAAKASPDYCFPWRLEEMRLLQDALISHPEDGRACYYLGNLLYDKKRRTEAIRLWKEAVRLEPGFAIPWRNLGLAAYNVEKDIDLALAYFKKAVITNPDDPRLFLEYDALLRRKAVPPQERLKLYLTRPDLVARRDDLTLELMRLYTLNGEAEKALAIANRRVFHPWEGGEGSVAGTVANACWVLGRKALEDGNPKNAIRRLQEGLTFKENLGETPGDEEVVSLHYLMGLAYTTMGEGSSARQAFETILRMRGGDLSLIACYQGMALIQLCRMDEGMDKLRQLKCKALQAAETGIPEDYFYYGNPSPTFEDDPHQQQRIQFTFLAGMACLGLDDPIGACSAFAQVAALDPSHLFAMEELKRL